MIFILNLAATASQFAPAAWPRRVVSEVNPCASEAPKIRNYPANLCLRGVLEKNKPFQFLEPVPLRRLRPLKPEIHEVVLTVKSSGFRV